MAGGFDGIIQGPNNILFRKIEFAILVHPLVKIFAQSAAGYGYVVSINQPVLQKEMEYF